MNKVKENTLFLLCIFMLLFSACSNKKSSEFGTQDIYAVYQVVGDSQKSLTSCFAQFFIRNKAGLSLELSGGDSITCNGVPMAKTPQQGTSVVTYRADLSTSNQDVQIQFHRAGGENYTTELIPPEPIRMIAPLHQEKIMKTQGLNVKWLPSNGANTFMQVNLVFTVNGVAYRFNKGDKIADAGETKFLPRETFPVPVAGNWRANLTISRLQSNPLPIGLNGEAWSSQIRSIDIDLVDRP